MFALKIHTIGFPEPLNTTSGRSAAAAADSNVNRTPIELRSFAHLFHQLPSAIHPTVTVDSISAGPTRVFVAALPSYLPPNDFLLFCGNSVGDFEQTLFLKNDEREDKYSVLITLESRSADDEFYSSFNGKRFKPSEGEVCHIYFPHSVQFTKFEEVASKPPPGYTEYKSCPVKLEISQTMEPEKKSLENVQRAENKAMDMRLGETEKELHVTKMKLKETIKELQVMKKFLESVEKGKQDMTKQWHLAETEKKAVQEKCREVEMDKQSYSDVNFRLREENKGLATLNSQRQKEKEDLHELNKKLLQEVQVLRSKLETEKKLRESWEAEKQLRNSWDAWD